MLEGASWTVVDWVDGDCVGFDCVDVECVEVVFGVAAAGFGVVVGVAFVVVEGSLDNTLTTLLAALSEESGMGFLMPLQPAVMIFKNSLSTLRKSSMQL